MAFEETRQASGGNLPFCHPFSLHPAKQTRESGHSGPDSRESSSP